ncbi:protein KASH5-like [Patiria miniata]|uniref:GRIP domain-containing protein n=1 Tax=Patiria miniata TaxID=46514 RepID=A0A913ZL94_PATMI|nr:protein KASH5-like [Patiria miniata]
MATAGRSVSVDTDKDTNHVNQNPRRASQDDEATRSDEGQETITDSSVAVSRPKQQTEDVIVKEDGRKNSGKNATNTSSTLSEDSKNIVTYDNVLLNSNANHNSNTASSTKHTRQPPSRPRETKASQLRIQSHSVTEMNPSDKSNVKRQNSLKSEKPPSPGSLPVKHALRSQSTSSEDSFERDKMESVLPQNLNKGKAVSHDCVSPYGPATEKYLTPLQQKERHNKDLSMQISKLERTLLSQDDRIRQFEEEKQRALEDVGKVKDTEMGKLLIEIKNLQIHLEESKNSISEISGLLSDEKKMTASLKEQMTTMQREQEEREAVHQTRYLDMYQKGREAQLIDQEEDLICMAIATAPAGDGQNRHLVKKLERTEQELEKLRQTFREDVYHKTPQLDTDSAAQVEILKSAVYYYLTDTQPEVNLSVMLSMLNYSDVQRKNIKSHINKKSK